MKVYYEPPDKHDAVGGAMSSGLSTLPPAIRKTVAPLFEKVADLEYKFSVASFETFKYRTMWALRFIENQINEEGGMIIINDAGKIDLKGFSAQLSEIIHEHFERFME